MRLLIALPLWGLFFLLCWPLALLALILLPVLWLLSIPFRVVGSVLHGFLGLIQAILMLPARLLGYRS